MISEKPLFTLMSVAEITLRFHNTHSFKDMEEIRNFAQMFYLLQQ